MRLDELGLHYRTDKASNGHDYLRIYEGIIPTEEPISLLEIGWFDGASMKMWRDYLAPGSTIVGVDIVPKKRIEGVEFIQANATTSVLPERLRQGGRTQFDVIVDDGSHLSPDVIATLALLWDFVKPGGYFIVEDLHVSYHRDWKGWDPTHPTRGKINGLTSMEYLKRVSDDVHYRHAGAGASGVTLGSDIESIAFHPGVAIIKKRDQ